MAKFTATAVRCKYFVGNLLLFGRQRCIKRLGCRDALLKVFQCDGVELLSPLETVDCGRPLPFITLVALRTPLLNALILRACLIAQRVGKCIPLRLLLGSDPQRGLEIGKLRFDALARHGKSAPLMMSAL